MTKFMWSTCGSTAAHRAAPYVVTSVVRLSVLTDRQEPTDRGPVADRAAVGSEYHAPFAMASSDSWLLHLCYNDGHA